MAARRGHVDSQFALGHVYEHNYEGVGIDIERARYWYSEAAKSGDPRAQQKLTLLKNE
jgi:TPR repeat protein